MGADLCAQLSRFCFRSLSGVAERGLRIKNRVEGKKKREKARRDKLLFLLDLSRGPPLYKVCRNNTAESCAWGARTHGGFSAITFVMEAV